MTMEKLYIDEEMCHLELGRFADIVRQLQLMSIGGRRIAVIYPRSCLH